MGDQADKLRLLVKNSPRWEPQNLAEPPMIAVTAGRVGVGATTVAVNLAAVLADGGKRVLLLDAAEQQASIAEAAGVRLRGTDRRLCDVLSGDCPIGDALLPGPPGVLLLASCSRASVTRQRSSRKNSLMWSRHAQQRLMSELQSLRGAIDLIVADIGAGLMTPWTRRFWLRAQLVLVVTTTEAPTILDTYATIKRSVADVLRPDLRLLMNRCENRRTAAAAESRLVDACRRFLQRNVPALPSLPLFVESDAGGTPSLPRVWKSPNTPFGHAVLWLGRAVSDALENASSNPTDVGSEHASDASLACAAGF